jgi:hypothetical protein
MSINVNKLQGMMKQNDGIYSGLLKRNIEFVRHSIDLTNLESKTQEELTQIIDQIQKENAELKDLANKNKPPPQVKEPKPVVVVEKTVSKPKPTDEEADSSDENHEDPVKKFSTIFNMEDAKRAFFAKEYEQFTEIIRSQPQLTFYTATYKYSSDKDGVPSFSAKNLVGGFVRSFDDYRKYFMICCRCIKHETDTTYTYPSLWIVNSTDQVKDIIGSLYDDYEFEQVEFSDEFISSLKKIKDTELDNDLLIEEKYVH